MAYIVTPEKMESLKRAWEATPTHHISFSREEDDFSNDQFAFGRKDLYDCIRSMMNDGFDAITINVVKVK